MALPSPICLVNGSSVPPAKSVTKGSTVTIALENPAGAQYWSISCTSTDETNNAATINATLVVNMGAKTATFTAPNSYGSAMIFTSIVGIDNVGVDANRTVQAALTTTFKVNVLTTLGIPVFAADEELESNASFGWIVLLNSFIRVAPSTLPNGTADQLLDTDHTGNFVEWFTAGGDVTFASHDFTVTGLKGKALPSLAAGVLLYTGSAWTLTTGTADQLLDTNHAGTAAEWFTVGGDLAYASHSFTVQSAAGSFAVTSNLTVGGSTTIGGPTTLTALAGNGNGYALISNTGLVSWTAEPPVPEFNPQQIAILRWYGANQTGLVATVQTQPTGICFDGTNIWTTNGASNSVSKNLALTGAPIAAYTVGSGPFSCCFDGNYIWVTNASSGNVSRLSAYDEVTVETYTVGADPQSCCFTGKHIWVGNSGSGNVTKLLASTGAFVATITVGSSPNGICFDGTNIWVANAGNNNVTKILASNDTIVGTVTVGSDPFAICFDGNYIWVVNSSGGNVTKILATTGAVVGTVTVGTSPWAICFDGAYIWVTNVGSQNVTKILASTSSVVGTYTAGTNPEGICFDGTNIWVVNEGSNNVSKL